MARPQRPTRPRAAPDRAARERAERVPATLPEESRAAAWLRTFRLSGFTLTTLILLVSALIVLAPGLKTFFEQRQQIAQLEQEVVDAQQEVDDLNAEIARWSDPAYIEAQARDRLYYVYPGDIAFLVIGGDEEGLDDGGLPVSAEIQSTQVDWVRALLSTVYQAGLTEATPEQIDSPGQTG